MKKNIFIIIVSLLLSACASPDYMAPVSSAWRPSENPHNSYVVRSGDTLYAVAWRYDVDYRSLAQINHLKSPYNLVSGQHLLIKPSAYKEKRSVITSRYKHSKHVTLRHAEKVSRRSSKTQTKLSNKGSTEVIKVSQGVSRWLWPANGKVVQQFSLANSNKGIDIAGHLGEAVVATAAGRVAYSGSGLPGYGNLLIIKHNDDFLSAYAHNRKLLVKEGDNVKAGQQIAEMGSERDRPMLHFEIRKAGSPVDPLYYLPRR